MKLIVFFFSFLLGAKILMAAEEVQPILLRYSLPSAETNAYNLRIESSSDTGREAIAGIFLISGHPLQSNLLELTFHGRLEPTNTSGPGSRMNFGWYGQRFSLSSYRANYYQGMDQKELVVDDQGRFLRVAGDQALPVPLGSLMSSFLERFPSNKFTTREQERDVFVLDDPLLQGPLSTFMSRDNFANNYGFRFGQGTQATLAARQKIQIHLTEMTSNTVSFEQTMSLTTIILNGTEPRISATAVSKIVLDRTTGWPETIDCKATTSVLTDEVSQRLQLSLQWKKLAGAEKMAALAAPPPVRPKPPLSPERVSELQNQLTEATPMRQNAAQELSSSPLERPNPKLLAAMAALSTDADDTVRHAAIVVLAKYGSAEYVPILIRALHDPVPGIAPAVFHGLARIKDRHSAVALADFLASGLVADQQYNQTPRPNEAATALIKIGPSTEELVIAILKEKNIESRVQACLVLKQIGTKKSLGRLKDLTSYPNKELSDAAGDACRTITERIKK